MPIYEEKLISPLAIRFTQEHIRPVFQAGEDLEATVKQIKTRPGTHDYDVILEAPFPNIEVVRWHQRDAQHVEPDADHWFSLDNRRLYCLQRAAAALWPRRVAAVVELLYAPTDGMRRKDDSSTAGRSVGVGHSLKELRGRWDWRGAVREPAGAAARHAAALALVAADDARAAVHDLVDAPAPPSMLDLLLRGVDLGAGGADGEGAGEKEAVARPVAEVSSDQSTAHGTTPRSWQSCPDESPAWWAAPTRWDALAEARHGLRGTWHGGKGDSYNIKLTKGETWVCTRTDSDGSSKRFTLWYEPESDAVWWGNNWSLYLNLAEARSDWSCLKWRDGSDMGNAKPRFLWRKAKAEESTWTGATEPEELLPAPRLGRFRRRVGEQ